MLSLEDKTHKIDMFPATRLFAPPSFLLLQKSQIFSLLVVAKAILIFCNNLLYCLWASNEVDKSSQQLVKFYEVQNKSWEANEVLGMMA